MLRLIDNGSNERIQGSRTTIKALVYRRFTQYKKQGLLKGIVFINNTYYLG